MTKIEIISLICIVSIPLIALFFVLPKVKKSSKEEEKVKPPETKTLEEFKKENNEPETKEKADNKSKQMNEDIDEIMDYKSYMQNKKDKLKLPELKPVSSDSLLLNADDDMLNIGKSKDKTIAEQIDKLSPELKALIFTGVLDRKYFDNK